MTDQAKEAANDEPNLYELRKMVSSIVGGKEIVAFGMVYALEQASKWPYGTYSPNDLTTMYEHGFLRGYLNGAAELQKKGE